MKTQDVTILSFTEDLVTMDPVTAQNDLDTKAYEHQRPFDKQNGEAISALMAEGIRPTRDHFSPTKQRIGARRLRRIVGTQRGSRTPSWLALGRRFWPPRPMDWLPHAGWQPKRWNPEEAGAAPA